MGYYCRQIEYSDGEIEGADAPVICPNGQYCPEGRDEGEQCPPGTYTPAQTAGLESVQQCNPCEPGKYCTGG